MSSTARPTASTDDFTVSTDAFAEAIVSSTVERSELTSSRMGCSDCSSDEETSVWTFPGRLVSSELKWGLTLE